MNITHNDVMVGSIAITLAITLIVLWMTGHLV
jgi:hypothetical protein